MATFYVHRTYQAEVVEVVRVEAPNRKKALQIVWDGAGEYIGHVVNDKLGFSCDEDEVFPAAPHNLPVGLLVPEKEPVS